MICLLKATELILLVDSASFCGRSDQNGTPPPEEEGTALGAPQDVPRGVAGQRGVPLCRGITNFARVYLWCVLVVRHDAKHPHR